VGLSRLSRPRNGGGDRLEGDLFTPFVRIVPGATAGSATSVPRVRDAARRAESVAYAFEPRARAWSSRRTWGAPSTGSWTSCAKPRR
jgi:hypothetical protein